MVHGITLWGPDSLFNAVDTSPKTAEALYFTHVDISNTSISLEWISASKMAKQGCTDAAFQMYIAKLTERKSDQNTPQPTTSVSQEQATQAPSVSSSPIPSRPPTVLGRPSLSEGTVTVTGEVPVVSKDEFEAFHSFGMGRFLETNEEF